MNSSAKSDRLFLFAALLVCPNIVQLQHVNLRKHRLTSNTLDTSIQQCHVLDAALCALLTHSPGLLRCPTLSLQIGLHTDERFRNSLDVLAEFVGQSYARVMEPLESLLPDFHERLPNQAVAGMKRSPIDRFVIRFRRH